ncbi:MAG: hypothetical protein ABFC77_10250 [Thermoguttaceae bacterium]
MRCFVFGLALLTTLGVGLGIAAEPKRADVPQSTPKPLEQVLLHVRVLELSRTKMQRLGFDFSLVGDNAPDHIAQLVEALQKDKLAKLLADPTLVTANGRDAHFHSGDEILIPKQRDDGTVEHISKPYGTMIDFHPVVQKDRTIQVKCHIEVSDLDKAHPVQIAGETVPGLRWRTCETQLKLRPGETQMVHGLVQSRFVEKKNRPSEKEEYETLILLAAEIVEPMESAGL